MWLILLGISITAMVEAVRQHREMEKFLNKSKEAHCESLLSYFFAVCFKIP